MAKIDHTLSIIKGETLFLSCFRHEDGGAATDLTGSLITLNADAELTGLTSEIVDATNGHFTIRSEDTDSWPRGTWTLQAWHSSPDGSDVEEEVVFTFKVSVSEAV
jgi:hypothetical protein